LKEIYVSFRSKLVLTAFYFLKDIELAEDIVGDVFHKLLEMDTKERSEKLANVNDKIDVFLKVIVKNKCLDNLKVEKNRKVLQQGIFLMLSRSIHHHPLIEEDFQQMLAILPERQREVLALHLKGFENEEIAQQLNITYNTVRNTLSNGKKKIRELWKTFMN